MPKYRDVSGEKKSMNRAETSSFAHPVHVCNHTLISFLSSLLLQKNGVGIVFRRPISNFLSTKSISSFENLLFFSYRAFSVAEKTDNLLNKHIKEKLSNFEVPQIRTASKKPHYLHSMKMLLKNQETFLNSQ
jgi:hypothetical protein